MLQAIWSLWSADIDSENLNKSIKKTDEKSMINKKSSVRKSATYVRRLFPKLPTPKPANYGSNAFSIYGQIITHPEIGGLWVKDSANAVA